MNNSSLDKIFGESIALFVLFVIVIAIMLMASVYNADRIKCEHQWERSGMKHEWDLTTGCMIQRKDGTWIPASAYIEISHEPREHKELPAWRSRMTRFS